VGVCRREPLPGCLIWTLPPRRRAALTRPAFPFSPIHPSGSPASGSVAISASFDDTIRVFDIKSRTQTHSIRHNNQTGRWLTSFQVQFPCCASSQFLPACTPDCCR
jgi:WD40 repeat protein